MGLVLEIIGIVVTVILILILMKMMTSPQKEKVELGPGGCPHTSNAKLKVTALGDREDYYLCKLCKMKVKATDLKYFEKGGI